MKYAVLKLVTSEIVVSLIGETMQDYIQLISPFQVYTEVEYSEDGTVTNTGLKPFCPYTDSEIINLPMQHIIYITDLRPSLAEVYKNLVESYLNPIEPITPASTFTVEASNTIQ